jgi:hypothetical protein
MSGEIENDGGTGVIFRLKQAHIALDSSAFPVLMRP